ncbi:PP2C family protein-serine/threonine phosphatase [Nocardia sp. NPDC050175]|uniref:PP2C family protein-serine/threonine phosphatase n=1 Tax=Nocardia sp. NPDC050175 TaxID=3364317 RepID=UPI00378CE1BA
MAHIRISAVTHRGRIRAHNEDGIGCGGWSLRGGAPAEISIEQTVVDPVTVVVCDGMGGHAGGADASRLACEMLSAPSELDSAAKPVDRMRALLQQTSDMINDIAEQRPDLRGMGCTAVGVTVYPDGSALVFNVGDSRAYRLEGRYLAQLSVDHRAPDSNRLQQALGGGLRTVLEPDFFECVLAPAEDLLLCTDGLNDYAGAGHIEKAVVAGGPEMLSRLRDLALAGGGGDNISVVRIETIVRGAHG